LTKKPQLFLVFSFFWAFLEIYSEFFWWRSEFFWMFFLRFYFLGFFGNLQWIFLDEGRIFFGCFFCVFIFWAFL
jgi:hypothetical protein